MLDQLVLALEILSLPTAGQIAFPFFKAFIHVLDIILVPKALTTNLASELEIIKLTLDELVDLIVDDHIVCFASRTDVRLLRPAHEAGMTLHPVASHTLNRVYQNVGTIKRAPQILLVAQVVFSFIDRHVTV